MSEATAKVCVGCGNDVSGKKHTKDAGGRYYCHTCAEKRRTADTSAKTPAFDIPFCKSCGGKIDVSRDKLRTRCVQCGKVSVIAAEHSVPSAEQPAPDQGLDLDAIGLLEGLSSTSERDDDPFVCPICSQEVLIQEMDLSGVCFYCIKKRNASPRPAIAHQAKSAIGSRAERHSQSQAPLVLSIVALALTVAVVGFLTLNKRGTNQDPEGGAHSSTSQRETESAATRPPEPISPHVASFDDFAHTARQLAARLDNGLTLQQLRVKGGDLTDAFASIDRHESATLSADADDVLKYLKLADQTWEVNGDMQSFVKQGLTLLSHSIDKFLHDYDQTTQSQP